jgi:hypothetical protein
MPLFGSESTTTNTTRQQGAEGEKNIVASGDVTQNFPDTVASFAEKTLGLAESVVQSSTGIASDTTSNLGDIATREKTPEASFVPFAVIAAVAVVIIGIFGDY